MFPKVKHSWMLYHWDEIPLSFQEIYGTNNIYVNNLNAYRAKLCFKQEQNDLGIEKCEYSSSICHCSNLSEEEKYDPTFEEYSFWEGISEEFIQINSIKPLKKQSEYTNSNQLDKSSKQLNLFIENSISNEENTQISNGIQPVISMDDIQSIQTLNNNTISSFDIEIENNHPTFNPLDIFETQNTHDTHDTHDAPNVLDTLDQLDFIEALEMQHKNSYSTQSQAQSQIHSQLQSHRNNENVGDEEYLKNEEYLGNEVNEKIMTNYYICDICQSYFFTSNQHSIHIFEFHNAQFENFAIFECPLCGQYFKSGPQRNVHLQQEHRLKPGQSIDTLLQGIPLCIFKS